jgi:hypothetical protein
MSLAYVMLAATLGQLSFKVEYVSLQNSVPIECYRDDASSHSHH